MCHVYVCTYVVPTVEKERKGDFVVNSIKFDARASFFEGDSGLGHSLGFDMSTFMSEVQRLKLDNQQLSITVHTIEGATEPTLSLGLAGCRRYRTEASPDSFSGSSSSSSRRMDLNVSHYYSADCVWRHLQHTDAGEQAEAEAAQRGEEAGGAPDLPDSQHVVSIISLAYLSLVCPVLCCAVILLCGCLSISSIIQF